MTSYAFRPFMALVLGVHVAIELDAHEHAVTVEEVAAHQAVPLQGLENFSASDSGQDSEPPGLGSARGNWKAGEMSIICSPDLASMGNAAQDWHRNLLRLVHCLSSVVSGRQSPGVAS